MTSTPPREMDPRGFVVPQVGDVVKVPSKWPGEWDVAQVDFVQFVSSRQAYEVDLLPLKSVGQSMYRLPGRKPAAVRADVAKLSRLAATYVRASDAYQIDEAELQPLGGTRRSSVLKAPPWWRHSLRPRPPRMQDGSGLPTNPRGAPRRRSGPNASTWFCHHPAPTSLMLRLSTPRPENPDVTAQGLEEYRELKATLLREAALVGAASSVATLPFLGAEVSGAIAAGAAAGCAYLFLLGRETDTVGDSAEAAAGRSKAEALAVAGRLGVPVVLFAALAGRNALTGHAPDGASALSLVSPAQCAGAIGGFLAYKAPLLGRQLGMAIAEYSKPEAQAPLGMGGGLPTGSLGIALRVAQERRAARSWSAGFQHGACHRCPQRPIGPLGVSVGPGRAYFHLSAA